MKQITDAEELSALTKADSTHVFFFTAGWCSDCAFIKPRMPEIEAEHPALDFVEVDRDANMDLAIDWGIMGIPSFVVMENGEEKARLVNKLRKTKEEVNAFLETVQ